MKQINGTTESNDSLEKIQEMAVFEVEDLDKDELRELLKESTKPPPGIPGLARTTIALTVIVILGVALFHLLTDNGSGDNSGIINSVLSVLAGLLAAITGFYFGGRAAEKKPDETEKKPGTQQ